jgi:hypothetical protein
LGISAFFFVDVLAFCWLSENQKRHGPFLQLDDLGLLFCGCPGFLAGFLEFPTVQALAKFLSQQGTDKVDAATAAAQKKESLAKGTARRQAAQRRRKRRP